MSDGLTRQSRNDKISRVHLTTPPPSEELNPPSDTNSSSRPKNSSSRPKNSSSRPKNSSSRPNLNPTGSRTPSAACFGMRRTSPTTTAHSPLAHIPTKATPAWIEQQPQPTTAHVSADLRPHSPTPASARDQPGTENETGTKTRNPPPPQKKTDRSSSQLSMLVRRVQLRLSEQRGLVSVHVHFPTCLPQALTHTYLLHTQL